MHFVKKHDIGNAFNMRFYGHALFESLKGFESILPIT